MANRPACLSSVRLRNLLCRSVSPPNHAGKESQLFIVLGRVPVLGVVMKDDAPSAHPINHKCEEEPMKIMLIVFAVGLVVSVMNGMIRVESPAQPRVARIGLLGITWGSK